MRRLGLSVALLALVLAGACEARSYAHAPRIGGRHRAGVREISAAADQDARAVRVSAV
jgi:hypothetical protein